jgi:hypothetical protein
MVLVYDSRWGAPANEGERRRALENIQRVLDEHTENGYRLASTNVDTVVASRYEDGHIYKTDTSETWLYLFFVRDMT